MKTRRKRLAPLTAAAAALVAAAALPAAASATDYCVKPKATCGVNNLDTLETALDEAAKQPNQDRILLGAHEYEASNPSGYSYLHPGSPVEIVGQGRGVTTLTGQDGGNGVVLRLIAGPGTSVRDLTVKLPQNAVQGLTGLWTDGLARRIEVVENPTQVNTRNGVWLQEGGVLEDSSVTLVGPGNASGVLFGPGGPTLRASVVSAHSGVRSGYGGTIERAHITSHGSDGVRATRGITAITGSMIRFDGDTGGITAATAADGDPIVNADGVTIIGPYATDSAGVVADTFGYPARSAEINLTNSVIRGVESPAFVRAPGEGHATVNVSYSDYDPVANYVTGTNAAVNKANLSHVGDAGFADPAAGDFRLLPGSPLVDAGLPTAVQGLDLDGNPLIADGDGDGTARRDIGAYELQPGASPQPGPAPPAAPVAPVTPAAPVDQTAPALSALKVAPGLITRGNALPSLTNSTRKPRIEVAVSERARLTFRFKRYARGSWRPVRGQIAIPADRVDAGLVRLRFAGRLSASRRLTPGRYRVQVVATDLAGNRSKTATARFRLRR
jgi:hypothetical protein